MTKKILRSPLFYVGDKYKLMKQLINLFPKEINNYYEPFVGGGTVFLNIDAKKYVLSDSNKHLINIHKFLMDCSITPDKFFDQVQLLINQYNLSKSFKEDVIPDSLKKEWKKTYFARYNKEGYERLKEHVNNKGKNDPLILYLLLIYGFNRMLRFNGGGKFNLPVGNVDFNKNVVNALNGYFHFVQNKKIKITSQDFRTFFIKKEFQKNDFIYLDPPYLITSSEYNKFWNSQTEIDLLNVIDKLNKKGIKFALSNVTHYNEENNSLLIKWMGKYNIHKIESNYINYHNNRKKIIKEVLITNY
ncbi:MAG: DNA adenine methylase [Melioribacteraceae bacterium]